MRKRKPPSKPSKSYMISFGDTMTAMLAFFIVLNTLAKEQTGANLHTGTGSFIAAISSMGLPGTMPTASSKYVLQMQDATPKYIVRDEKMKEDLHGDGPDEESNLLRVQDRELENLQRAIVEWEQHFEVKMDAEESSAVTIDLFQPFGKAPNLLPKDAKKVLVESLAMLSRPGYELEIDVWAPTPSKSAITRMTKTAKLVKQTLRRDFPMLFGNGDTVRCRVKLWPLSDEKRPVMSITIIRRVAS